jgi:hypothetical protein
VRWRSALALHALLLTLISLVACGGPLTGVGGSPAGSSTPGPKAPPVILPTIAYAVTPDTTTQDVPILIRKGGATDAIQLGDGIVLTGVSPDVLLVQHKDGHVVAFRLGDRPAPFSDRRPRSGRADGLVIGSILYEFSYDELVAIDERGASLVLPLPSAVATTVGPCELQKGLIDLNSSGLYAIASVQGHPYGYVATLGNGAIVNLDDGRRLDLIDAGYALAMTDGSDRRLYTVTIDGRCASNHLMVRRINPATMREEAVIDTGGTLPVERLGLITAIGGSTYVHEITASGAQFLRVDRTAVTPIPLPPDSGLFEAAAPDGTLYVFGGRARNVVTRFDPSTGTVTTVDAAKAPDGSFIEALFFGR